MTLASEPLAWIAAGYGLFLLLVAHLLDHGARRTSKRASRWRSGAFVYHEDHDAWLCPEDQWLWPQSFDPDNRVMRYRGAPAVCNACPVKDSCTSSDAGREVQRAVDPWPASESERFHRGIACTVVALGALWPAGMLVTAGTWTERAVLVAALALIAVGAWPLFAHLRRTPSRFPEHVPVRTLDDAAAAAAVAQAREVRRRTGYRSDRDRRVPGAGAGAGAGSGAGSGPVPVAAPHRPSAAERDRFATRWGAFTDETALPDAGWSRRRPS